VVVAVIALLGLVAGLVAVLARDDGDEVLEGSGDDFDSVVAQISAFVEDERGLDFREPVEVELADDEEFTARLFEDFEEGLDDIAESELVFQALGLIPPGTDLAAALQEALSAGVVGFYDPETNELVVRGTETTPYVRVTMAHELTHALDDQHFELDRPELDESDGEEGFGFGAVVEGDAVVVEQAYLETLSPGELDDYAETEREIGAEFPVFSVPPVVLDFLVAPYTLGPALVDDVLDEGGQGALDAAFEEPPITSEQVMESDKFLEGEGPAPVEAPPADGDIASEGAFGAFALQLLLADELDGGDVVDAVEGWGGDAYVAWSEGDEACIRASFVGDTGADTEELARALTSWAEGADATVDAGEGDPVTISRCA
jgi:hypothetical protein